MEYMDYCITHKGEETLSLTLDALYYVFADSDYRIKHYPIPDSWVLVLTLNGQGHLHINEQTCSLAGGDILLFWADTNFTYNCAGTHWNFWWFEFRAPPRHTLGIPQGVKFNMPLKENQLDLCQEALQAMKLKDTTMASTMLSALICLLRSTTNQKTSIRNAFKLFQSADQYIRRNLAKATVESTARYLDISERTLRNLFQSLLDCKPGDYIQRLKLEMVCHLLRTGQETLRDIAAVVGYADQFVLSKSFRRFYGVPPQQYRMMEKDIFVP